MPQLPALGNVTPRAHRGQAERQLAAAAERHAEVVAAIRLGARSPSSQQTATRALARGVQLVSFALGRAAAAGVPLERLVELTGWEEPLVLDALEHGPEPPVVARITPEGLDPDAVAQAASSFEATARLDALLAGIAADIGDPAWSPRQPTSTSSASVSRRRGARGARVWAGAAPDRRSARRRLGRRRRASALALRGDTTTFQASPTRRISRINQPLGSSTPPMCAARGRRSARMRGGCDARPRPATAARARRRWSSDRLARSGGGRRSGRHC